MAVIKSSPRITFKNFKSEHYLVKITAGKLKTNSPLLNVKRWWGRGPENGTALFWLWPQRTVSKAKTHPEARASCLFQGCFGKSEILTAALVPSYSPERAKTQAVGN